MTPEQLREAIDTVDDPSFHPSCSQYKAGTERSIAFRGTSTWNLLPEWFRNAVNMVGWHTIDMADVACQARSDLGSDVLLNWPLNDESLMTFELRMRSGETYEVRPFCGEWKISQKGEADWHSHATPADAFRWAIADSTPPVAPDQAVIPDETPWGVLAANVERICGRDGVNPALTVVHMPGFSMVLSLLIELGQSGAVNLTDDGLDAIANTVNTTAKELLRPPAPAEGETPSPGDILAENLSRAIENCPWSISWLAQEISATEEEIEALMIGGDCAIPSGFLGRLADALKTTPAELLTPRERPVAPAVVPQNVCQLRNVRGLTVEELAEKVGVDPSVVREAETSGVFNVTIDPIQRLADALVTTRVALTRDLEEPEA